MKILISGIDSIFLSYYVKDWKILDSTWDKIEDAYNVINEWLYQKHVTKFDAREKINPRGFEDVNEHEGFF